MERDHLPDPPEPSEEFFRVEQVVHDAFEDGMRAGRKQLVFEICFCCFAAGICFVVVVFMWGA